MPTKRRQAIVSKSHIKTSTLIVMAWAVAFASVGLSASRTKPILIRSFVEGSHGAIATYIYSAARTAGARSVGINNIQSGTNLRFGAQTNGGTGSTDFLFYAKRYDAGSIPVGTAVPSGSAVNDALAHAARGEVIQPNSLSKYNWTVPQYGGAGTNIIDVFVFLTPAGSSATYLDYSVIRYNILVQAPRIVLQRDVAFPNRSAYLPTGVPGSRNVKIGAFIVSATASEPVDIQNILLKDPAGPIHLGNNFQNLRIEHNGVAVGTTIGTLNSGASQGTYTFTPMHAIRVAAGGTERFDIFADVKFGRTVANPEILLNPAVILDGVSATGAITLLDGSSTDDVSLQAAYISNSGNLTVIIDPSTPPAGQVLLGARGVEFAKFRFTAGALEDIMITELDVADFVSANATGTLRNIRIIASTSTVHSGVVAAFDTSSSTTRYVFAPFYDSRLIITKNSTVVLSVVADVADYDSGGMPRSTHSVGFLPNINTPPNGARESIAAYGVASQMAITGNTLNYSSTPDAPVFGNVMTTYSQGH